MEKFTNAMPRGYTYSRVAWKNEHNFVIQRRLLIFPTRWTTSLPSAVAAAPTAVVTADGEAMIIPADCKIENKPPISAPDCSKAAKLAAVSNTM